MTTTVAQAIRSFASSASANAALVKGKHNPCNATSAALTMTLPTGANPGSFLSVEKTDSSANTVTISGSIRGSASTIKLYWQNEALDLIADAAGSWWPIGDHKTKASFDAAYAGVGRAKLEVYDDFSRYADGPLAGVVPLIGSAWSTTGSNPTAVVSGYATSTSIGNYLYQTLARVPRIITCEVAFTGTGSSMTMGCSRAGDSTIVTNIGAHLNFSPTGFNLTTRKDASATFDPLRSGAWTVPAVADGTTLSRYTMMIIGNTVVIIGPNGESWSVTAPQIGELAGTVAFWQPNTQTSPAGQGFLRTARALTYLPTGQQGQLDHVLDLSSGANRDDYARLVGNPQDYGQVALGADPSNSNSPGVSFGAATVFTHLTAQANPGDATLHTAHKIPNGSSVQIEPSGTTSEVVTSTAASTGSATPYSTAVTAVAGTHVVGMPVLATPPAAARVSMWHNTDAHQFNMPNEAILFPFGGIFLGAATDPQIAKINSLTAGVGSGTCWRTGKNVTGSRPSALTAASAAQFYDTTQFKPIWSDGTFWRDARGFINPLITKTVSYSLADGDETVVFNNASLTATLPDPTSAVVGRKFTVKNVNSSALTVVSAGTSKTIDGASSASLAQWAVGRYVSDGTQWLAV